MQIFSTLLFSPHAHPALNVLRKNLMPMRNGVMRYHH